MQGSRRDSLDLAHPGRVFVGIALAVLVADQIAKLLARAYLGESNPIVLVPSVLHLTYVHNTGAAFGMFPGRQPVFMATSMLVVVAIGVYWWRVKPRQWPVVIALSLVTAGALGNLIDRAFVGQVTDFFEFAFINFPVFNVADIAICAGVATLAFWVLFGPAEGEDTPSDEAVAADAGPDSAHGVGAASSEVADRGSSETPRVRDAKPGDVA